MCFSDGTTTSGAQQQLQPLNKPWQCYSCNLMNSYLSAMCQGCLLSKFHSTYNIRFGGGYSHLSDNDLAEIILKSNTAQLRDIAASLEFNCAVYANHSFLSLLIDIGRINLIFLLFKRGYKFALNHRTQSEDEQNERKMDVDRECYVDDDQILPLSMAFERDEVYLIKLLLKKGANPNQWTKPQHLSLHYEWFDLSRYAVYVHFLPISIPIRKRRHRQIEDGEYQPNEHPLRLTEYEEIFDLLIHHGALWFEDEFWTLFSAQDAIFWVDFLSSYRFRAERLCIHNAMKRHYAKSIRSAILSGPLAPIESVLAQYFIAFPMIDIPVDECDEYKISDRGDELLRIGDLLNVSVRSESSDMSDHRDRRNDVDPLPLDGEHGIFSDLRSTMLTALSTTNTVRFRGRVKILSMKEDDGEREPMHEVNGWMEQREYTVADREGVAMGLVIYDERIYAELHVGDVIEIGNATVLRNEHSMKLVHSTTKTPSISIVYDAEVLDMFESVH